VQNTSKLWRKNTSILAQLQISLCQEGNQKLKAETAHKITILHKAKLCITLLEEELHCSLGDKVRKRKLR